MNRRLMEVKGGFRLLLIELFHDVDIHDVQRELTISDKKWGTLSESVEKIFQHLLTIPIGKPSNLVFKINRETFDSLYIDTELKNSYEEYLKLCPSYHVFMNSFIDQEDINELEKPLLVAGAISFITMDGSVFTEADYQEALSNYSQHKLVNVLH